MGYFFEFDQENNVFRSTTEGRVTDETLLDSFAARQRFRASRPPCKSIIDLSLVTAVDVSRETIDHLARKSANIADSLPQVVVAPEDVTFGLSRMFTILVESAQPNMHVVRSMKEAYALLGIKSSHFTRVAIP